MRKTLDDKAKAFLGKHVASKISKLVLLGKVTSVDTIWLTLDDCYQISVLSVAVWSGTRKQLEATAREFLKEAFYKFISAGKCVKVSDTHISKSITFEMSGCECTLAKIYIQDKLGVPFKDYNEDGFETFWEFGNMQCVRIIEETDALPTIALVQYPL